MDTSKGYIRIANDIWDALIKSHFSGHERQIIDVVMRKTWGYNKKEDCISLSQFAEMTGIDRRNVVRAIQKLVDRNVITRGEITPRKGGLYSLNKQFNTWKGKEVGAKSPLALGAKTPPKVGAKSPHTKDNKRQERDKSLSVQDRRNPEIDFILSEYRRLLGHEPTDKKPRFVAHNLRQLTRTMVKDIAPFHPTGLSFETVITKLFEWYCTKYDEDMRGETLEIVKRKGTRLYFEAAREKYIPDYKLAKQNDQK